MAKMVVEIECLDRILEALDELRERVAKVEGRQAPAVIFLKEACALKGINWSTARAKPRYQPNGGRPDLLVTGKSAWFRETIEKWCREGD